MRFALIAALCTLFQTAYSAEYLEEWERLHEALLKESADGDLDGALIIFESLAGRLSSSPETGPILAEALFQLGYGYAKQGNTDLARVKLKECIRVSGSPRCRHLLSKIALDENALKELPVRWDFDNRQHGFVLIPGIGSVQVEVQEGSSHLKWSLPSGSNPDVLALTMNEPKPGPRKVRLSAYLAQGERLIYPVVEDQSGQRYVLRSGPLLIGTTPQTYEFVFRDFVGLDKPTVTLRSADFYQLELHERRVGGATELDQTMLHIQWFEML